MLKVCKEILNDKMSEKFIERALKFKTTHFIKTAGDISVTYGLNFYCNGSAEMINHYTAVH